MPFRYSSNRRGHKKLMVKLCKNVLAELGFSYVWHNQSTFNASALLVLEK